jgi:hypothetical protein
LLPAVQKRHEEVDVGLQQAVPLTIVSVQPRALPPLAKALYRPARAIIAVND